jgi:D-threo-aldose 1-dehydrogenase
VAVAVMGARNAAEVVDNTAMSELAVPAAFWHELRARQLVDARAPLPGGA